MEFTSRDIFFSVIMHIGLILMITMLNPFAVHMRRDFDSVAVNIISMPPLGEPALIEEKMPEITIPQATFEEEVEIPITPPESREELVPVEKKEPTIKPKNKPRKDTGYKGNAKEGETSKAGGTDVSDQLGPGTPFGTVTVDNASFNYPYYFVQAFGKIQRNWSNPVATNQPLFCTIYFQIIRSGTILDADIETSSGLPAYDRACLRAVKASSPLPPLPADFIDDIIGLHLEFHHQP